MTDVLHFSADHIDLFRIINCLNCLINIQRQLLMLFLPSWLHFRKFAISRELIDCKAPFFLQNDANQYKKIQKHSKDILFWEISESQKTNMLGHTYQDVWKVGPWKIWKMETLKLRNFETSKNESLQIWNYETSSWLKAHGSWPRRIWR